MEDEVRPLVEAAGILNFEESNLLKKLYPEPAVLQAAVKEDFDRFTKAEMEATGGLSGRGRAGPRTLQGVPRCCHRPQARRRVRTWIR